MSLPPYQIKIEIPKGLNSTNRERLFENIKTWIQDRSFRGLDKNNRKFKKYTEEYAEKKGVGQGEVNLVLSGEMLDELQLLNHGTGWIRIGYERGTDVAGKAEGNIIGSYGQDSGDSSKARDFLGVSTRDLKMLVDGLTISPEELTDETINENIFRVYKNADRAALDRMLSLMEESGV